MDTTFAGEPKGSPTDLHGRVLRDRRARNYGKAPRMGRPGKAHPRSTRLAARVHAYEEFTKGKATAAYKKPGSQKK